MLDVFTLVKDIPIPFVRFEKLLEISPILPLEILTAAHEFPVFVETRDVIGVYHGRLVDFLEGRTHVGVREENLVVDGVHWDIYR